MAIQPKFVNLNVLAQDFGLPATYLRDLAKSQKIPCLNVRGKLRFDPDAVAVALDKLAMSNEMRVEQRETVNA